MSEGLTMKYFVLSPTKQDDYGKASRDALRQYARSIESTNHALAADLEAWVRQIEQDFK